MNTTNLPEYRPVYRSLHRPLTVCGVDRRLFFLALLVGAATFNLFCRTALLRQSCSPVARRGRQPHDDFR
jgi:hypothetical protein